MTKLLVTGFFEKRSNERFDLIWNQVMKKRSEHGAISEPFIPCKRTLSRRYYFHATTTLMILTILLEILKRNFANPFILFIINCKT